MRAQEAKGFRLARRAPRAMNDSRHPPLLEPRLDEHSSVSIRLIIDACGPRVNELATAQIGDLDEDRNAIRVRPSGEKNERYRYLKLPADLFAALLATLPPREDRDLQRSLFQDLTDANVRTAITRACKATGTPHFSPHGLRRRRGSLHYKKTGSLAEVAELLGDSKRVAEQHHVYALTDYREADYGKLLRRVRTVHTPVNPVQLENVSLAGMS
jgi:integrase